MAMDGSRAASAAIVERLVFDGLCIDPLTREIHLDGRVRPVTGAEFELLLALARRAPHVVTNQDLLSEMWGIPWRGSTKSLQVHVSRLRTKLGEKGRRPRFIHNVHGRGYRFVGEPVAASQDLIFTDPVEFRFDRMLRLRSMTPDEPFLGWSPQEVVDDGHLPTPVNPRALALVVRVIVMHGLDSFIQVLPFAASDGEGTMRKMQVIALRDSHGDFDGFLARVDGIAHLDIGQTAH